MTDQESLLSAIHEHVELRAYDAAWPSLFVLERERLMALFPAVFIDIQHVGSTAVPDMTAKPIIDILAGVDSMEAANLLSGPLCNSGYGTSAEFNARFTDHKLFMRWADGRRTHHLHVVVHAGDAWRHRVEFRDALRSCAELAGRYASLKMDLAAKYKADRDAYTDAKTGFVRSVVPDA